MGRSISRPASHHGQVSTSAPNSRTFNVHLGLGGSAEATATSNCTSFLGLVKLGDSMGKGLGPPGLSRAAECRRRRHKPARVLLPSIRCGCDSALCPNRLFRAAIRYDLNISLALEVIVWLPCPSFATQSVEEHKASIPYFASNCG
jgi:hypothetical protein